METLTGITKLCRSLCVTLTGILCLLNLVAALSIVVQPRSKGVEEGSTFTLHCVVESSSQTYVVWYKEESPGSNIPLSSYRTIRREAPEAERLSIVGSGNTYNLQVVRANTNDESSYQCVAYSRGASVKSTVSRVTILPVGEHVRCETYPQHVDVGNLLRYTCRPPVSMPSTTVMAWWRGEERIINHQTITAISGGGLQLRYVVSEMDNYVQFTCTVGTDFTQAYGLNCSHIPLQVPLSASLDPEFNKVSVGRNAAFRCSAVSSPPVNRIKWVVGYGKNAKISGTGGRYEVKNDPRNSAVSTFIIKNVGNSDNGTSVRCVLQNDLRQKYIAQAYVIVSKTPTQNIPPRPPTTRTPIITPRRPVVKTTKRPRRPRATTARIPTTMILPTTSHKTTKIKHFYQPYHPDIEIIVPTDSTILSIDRQGNGENDLGNSSPQSSKSLVPTLASLFVLLVLVIIGSVLYFVVFRRKLLNKNNFDGEIQYRKSYDPKAPEPLTREERAAARMSLRLQTIEVVVNQPPPEWQSKLKDVTPVENEYTVDGKPISIIESSPPAHSTKSSDNDNEENGGDRRNSQEEELRDAIYALPAKKPSQTKREHEENRENHQKASRQISDTKKRLLLQDYNDQNNEQDEDIEWDQSSWDNSSFEEEEDTLERVNDGQMYSGPESGETIYANTPHDELEMNNDSYGPTYGNLPLQVSDPNYSRVASLK